MVSERWMKLNTVFLGGVLLIALCGVLQLMQGILIPFFVAMFLVYLVEPLQKLLLRIHCPTGLRVIAVLVLTGLVLYLVGVLIYSSLVSLSNNLPTYEQRVLGLLDDTVQLLHLPSDEVNRFMQNFRWSDHLEAGKVAQFIGASFGRFGEFIGNLFFVLLYMVYLLFERESFFNRVEKGFDPERAQRIKQIVTHINQQIANYLEIKTFVSFLTGGLITLVLFLFGVDFALFWGILAFLLNFIPSIGSIIATLPPIVIAFLQFDTIVTPLVTGVLLISIQVVVGNVVEPKVMGEKLGLSPLVVILALVFWGWLWGPVGMILSVPIVAAVRIVCENIEALRPISSFLAEKA